MGFKIGDRVYHYAFGISTITEVLFNTCDNTFGFTIEKLSQNNNFSITLTGVKPDDIYKLEIGEYVVNKLTNKIGKIKNVHIYNKLLLVVYDGNRSEYLDFDDVRGLDKNNESWSVFTSNLTKVEETKEMTSYKVGDIVDHPLYNESIIVDISEFETGYISIIPLTGLNRGLPVLVSINNVKHGDNKKLLISIKDYNKMANTIEDLRKEKVDLQEKVYNAYFGYKYKNLPEVKEVLYHNPATIIFWKDGTKTVVKCHDRDYFDKEKGFAMACLKKVLGNCGHYYEEVKKWVQ